MDRGFWTMTHRFFPMASNTWKWRLKRQWKRKKQRCPEVRPRVAIRPWRERRRHWWRWRHSKRLLRCQPLRLSLLKRTGERAISKISCKWSCIICIVKLWLTTADAWFFMCSCFIVLCYLIELLYTNDHRFVSIMCHSFNSLVFSTEVRFDAWLCTYDVFIT